jgi:plastocyanin
MAAQIERIAKASGRLGRRGALTKLAGVLALVLMALASDVAMTTAAGGPAVKIVNMGGTCTSLFCFTPAKVSIKLGTTVTWINTTNVSHTVTRCTVAACGVSGGTGHDTGFGSGLIGPGGSYSFKFDSKGTYVYYCQIHGYGVMHARIIEIT